MKNRTFIKMILDIFMIIALPLLMMQALVGEQLHEWLGIMIFIVFIIHHLLNMNWHKNLFNGQYNSTRFIITSLNLLIFICMILSAINGIILSHYAFVLLDISFGISFVRATHMIYTHWMFVLISFHLGMHAKVIKSYLEHFSKRTLGLVITRILTRFIIMIGIYGLNVFINTQLWQYMFYQEIFMFYDFNRVGLSVYFDYASIMILFSIFGYLISKISRNIIS